KPSMAETRAELENQESAVRVNTQDLTNLEKNEVVQTQTVCHHSGLNLRQFGCEGRQSTCRPGPQVQGGPALFSPYCNRETGYSSSPTSLKNITLYNTIIRRDTYEGMPARNHVTWSVSNL